MYSDTVTIFNRYQSRLGDMWYPTVLRGVNVIDSKASIVKVYGENSSDKIVLNVPYDSNGCVAGKKYMLPKEWENQTNNLLAQTITFNDRSGFDFFAVGDYGSTNPIADNDFTEGFYDYMNDKYDEVYAITSVSKLTVIPHFEITGK